MRLEKQITVACGTEKYFHWLQYHTWIQLEWRFQLSKGRNIAAQALAQAL